MVMGERIKRTVQDGKDKADQGDEPIADDSDQDKQADRAVWSATNPSSGRSTARPGHR